MYNSLIRDKNVNHVANMKLVEDRDDSSDEERDEHDSDSYGSEESHTFNEISSEEGR